MHLSRWLGHVRGHTVLPWVPSSLACPGRYLALGYVWRRSHLCYKDPPLLGAACRGMGFEEQEDPSAPSGKVFESAESYTNRLEGLMLLYGAIMQVRQRSTTVCRTVAAAGMCPTETLAAARAVRCCKQP